MMTDGGPWGLGGRWATIRYVVLAGVVGLALLLWQGSRGSRDWVGVPPGDPAGPQVSAPSEQDLSRLEREMASSLAEILARVEGAGRVHVKLTLAAGPRRLYERDHQSSLRVSEEHDSQGGVRSVVEETSSDVVVLSRSTSGDGPVIAGVTAVQVRGVLVVAEGASGPGVTARLTAAVAALLDLAPHRIQVVPGG